MNENPLGRQTSYPKAYDPGLLYRIERAGNRQALGLDAGQLPFGGYDHWRAYELSWLTTSGLPAVALADILVPCESPFLIESKSMKLYFNSLNQHHFADLESARRQISQDLSAAAGMAVEVRLYQGSAPELLTVDIDDVVLLDELHVRVDQYQPDAALLACQDAAPITETLVSHLFRSNCPITAQPDWGSLALHYRGRPIDHAGLLRYLVSYREHEGFHEQCVEQIFRDIMARCAPEKLMVSINFLRRGGLEINPLRTTNRKVVAKPLPRLLRQ